MISRPLAVEYEYVRNARRNSFPGLVGLRGVRTIGLKN